MNIVAGAVRLCGNPRFANYLAYRTGEIPVNREEAGKQLRALLGVKSRAELATNPAAERAYLELVNDFNDWLKRNK